MPQLEDGYTRIANELIDAISAIRVPGEAMQIFWFILRKTYGFNKKFDAIALSQFLAATGLKKPNICRALKKLADLNMVVIKKDNKRYQKRYFTVIKKDTYKRHYYKRHYYKRNNSFRRNKFDGCKSRKTCR